MSAYTSNIRVKMMPWMKALTILTYWYGRHIRRLGRFDVDFVVMPNAKRVNGQKILTAYWCKIRPVHKHKMR